MGLINWLKLVFFDIDDERLAYQRGELEEDNTTATVAPEVPEEPELPMTEEEKQLVAVIASCIVGKEKPDVKLHIHRIRKIA